MATLYQIKDFNIEIVTRNKKGHCVIRKASIHQYNITNIYAPKREPQNTLRERVNIQRKNRQCNSNSWSLQYYTFNNKITKQKISQKIEVLSSTTN